jgi:hypothetical protein
MTDPNALPRPENLDADYDLLDLAGADDPVRRLVMMRMVRLVPPKTIAQILRDEFGDDGGSAETTPTGGPITRSPLSTCGL